jgi:hypothetical protein
VIKSNAKTDMNVILLLDEAEHLELDGMLDTQLKDPATLQDWGQSQRTAAVILRAGFPSGDRSMIPKIKCG